MKNISLIVTDSSPLITLAVADALDTLLLTRQKIIVPDMVRYEVTRHLEKPGAQEVAQWIRDNEGEKLRVASTEAYEEFQIILATKPNAKTKGRGEEAASEILGKELDRGLEIGILLYEDSDVRKDNFLVRLPDNVLVMSTSEYLNGLETEGLIESAMDILERAVPARGEQI